MHKLFGYNFNRFLVCKLSTAVILQFSLNSERDQRHGLIDLTEKAFTFQLIIFSNWVEFKFAQWDSGRMQFALLISANALGFICFLIS